MKLTDLLRRDFKVLIVTDEHHKAKKISEVFDLDGYFKRRFGDGSEFRVIVIEGERDMDMLGGLTATHIFYDLNAKYSANVHMHLHSRLRSTLYTGPFVLQPFTMNELYA